MYASLMCGRCVDNQGGKMSQAGTKKSKETNAVTREQRLKISLKENLARRKRQERVRKVVAGHKKRDSQG